MEARTDFRNSVAVVIGINAYDQGVPPLNTAANDARRLGQLLADEYGYDVHLLIDEDASLVAIKNLFSDELAKAINSDDRVLFYFAGHGVALESEDGPTGYLLPQDARRGEPETYLHMPVLYDALSALECRHLLVILDSCFSGAFRWSSTRDVVTVPEVIHQERYDRFILDPAWQAIASASHDQTALDELPVFGSFGTRGEEGTHSPFADALFLALDGAADVMRDGQGDGVITASELYLYLEDCLQPATIEAGHRQTPSLWPLPKHDKGEFIFLVPGHELNLPPAPPLNYENNPWRGLEAYEEEHADLFFGREDVIDELAKHVENHPLTVVLGASGTGKSSVVKAGLLPKLKRDVAQAWSALPIVRPGAEPVQALLRATAELDSGSEVANENDVEERIAAWCRAHPSERLVLVVDQVEELVTMTKAPEEREATLALLFRLVEAHPKQFRLILTLRSDFEPQFDRTVLEALWKEARYVVPPMTQSDVRSVIEGPASQRVMYFKPHGLVDDLINEVIQTPGGLPLLSFALSEMYVHYVNRRSDDRAIEKVDYEAVGGVVGALRTRVDAEFEALDPAQQETMRRLMLRMVAVEGGNVARQRVPRSELEFPDPAETERSSEVVQRLTRARLVVEGREDNGEAYVEPAHDALVNAWDRLRQWIHAEEAQAADLHFQRRLTRASQEWAGADSDQMRKGVLWRDSSRGGLLLQQVIREERTLRPDALTRRRRIARAGREAWRRLRPAAAADDGVWMNRTELDFARASIRRRSQTRLGLGVLMALIVAGGVLSFIQAGIARQERDNALSSTLASRSLNMVQSRSYIPALLLAIQSGQIGDGAESREALIRVGQALPRLLVEPLPNGVFEAPPHTDFIGFSPDNTKLALGSIVPPSLQFTVWDLNSPGPPEAWNSDDGDLPDWLQRLASGRPAPRYSCGGLSEPCTDALSVDGTLYATGAALGLLELWSFAAGDTSLVWNDNTTFAHSTDAIAFSEDGSRVAFTGSLDNEQRVGVWSITPAQGGLPRRLLTAPSRDDLAVDPHGTRVATLNDGRVMLLNAADGTQLWASDTTLGMISTLAFSPDGTRLALGGGISEEGLYYDSQFAEVDPDESRGKVWMLDVASRRLSSQSFDVKDHVGQVAFDMTGQRLLTFDYAGLLLRVLNLSSSSQIDEEGSPWALDAAYGEQRGCTWISEQGQLKRFAGFSMETLDLSTGEVLSKEEMPVVNDASLFVCSSDGRMAAVVSTYTDGLKTSIQLFDLQAGQATGEPIPLTGSADDMEWSPDGKILAIASQGAVFLWSVADRAYLGSPLSYRSDIQAEFGTAASAADYFDNLTAAGQAVRDDVRIAFSSDGATLAASFLPEQGNATLALWNLTPDALMANACQLVNRNFSATEWTRHMGDRPYACTCPNLPPHPSLGLSSCPQP